MVEKRQLIDLVGKENVIDDEQTLKAYAKDLSFVPSVKPTCVIMLNKTDEVIEIMKWANQTVSPVVPVSSTGPHFRGDTIPSIGGTVIVDLSRLKRVLWVSSREGTAMIEPGVTFGELQQKVEKEGLRLNMPMLPRSSKSVIGSLLEREPVIMPKFHWEDGDPLGGTEVIWGNGDLFRTGALEVAGGTIQNAIESGSALNWPKGPVATDYYKFIQGSQGTMGIVTFATTRCERLPSIQEPFLVGSPDLAHLSELTYWLVRRRLVEECLILNDCNLAAILTQKWPEEYLTLRDNMPPWVLFFSINGYEYFPEERVAWQLEETMGIAKQIGVLPTKTINGVSAGELLKLLLRPSDEPYWKLRYKGACQDIFFLTTHDMLSKFVGVMTNIGGQHGHPVTDIGIYLQPTVQGSSWHCEFNLFYDQNKSGETDKVQRLFTEASAALIRRGAYFSRPYGLWADMVYARDAETTAGLRKVKKIFDPNGIMNPGKLCF